VPSASQSLTVVVLRSAAFAALPCPILVWLAQGLQFFTLEHISCNMSLTGRLCGWLLCCNTSIHLLVRHMCFSQRKVSAILWLGRSPVARRQLTSAAQCQGRQ
jgi:hypothetical protein